MTPFYITCYNSPALLKRLIGQLDDIVYSGDYQMIISDQSEEKEAKIYKEFADSKGFTYVHYQNEGASQAKRSVIAHALAHNYEFCHQISEDFIRVNDALIYGPVVSGSKSFDTDALILLRLRPDLSCVKWNAITSVDGDMAYLYNNPGGVRRFLAHKDMQLAYIDGSIAYSNWPATWRVKGVAKIWEKSLSWKAPNEYEAKMNKDSNGEWAALQVSYGSVACLLAQPFHHPVRTKPSTSLP